MSYDELFRLRDKNTKITNNFNIILWVGVAIQMACILIDNEYSVPPLGAIGTFMPFILILGFLISLIYKRLNTKRIKEIEEELNS